MKEKMQFSKVMVVITTILFILTLIASFSFMFFIGLYKTDAIVDYVVATTALTVVSGLYGAVLKYYLSKSARENTLHIKNDAYTNVMNTRLEYIEGVIKLRTKYGIDQCVVDEIEAESPFDDLSESALNQMVNRIDTAEAKDDEEPEIN